MPLRVLIVDDETPLADATRAFLEADGFSVAQAPNLSRGLELARDGRPDVILLDRMLPDGDGVDRVGDFRRESDGAAVVILTGAGETAAVVTAIKAGAANFLTKPVLPDELVALVRELSESVRRSRSLSNADMTPGGETLLGESPGIRQARRELDLAAKTDSTVLLLGESGAGKGLAARRVHAGSKRASMPFVDVNCAGFPATLAERELFGHERGSFTDARTRQIGLIEAADRGTLFLDEIAEAETGVQAKLLKVLESRSLRRLGGVTEIPIDVRLVAATNRDLRAAVDDGSFRRDLYFRLNVLAITLPPLRERPQDIPLLTTCLLHDLVRRMPRATASISSEAEAALLRHDWPGNVRELRNALERALIVSGDGSVELEHLPLEVRSRPAGPATERSGALDGVIDEAVRNAFAAAGGNVSEAAKTLGISRSTIYPRLRRLGLLKSAG